ncbi:DNA methylase N-4/N-6 [uncultured Caudovirales phage]|uniref:site-specific DNA-methyltransferase (cytosine-N(4)-specific) n=1 Tax=uncultured Caudovirales phage TaxID=2100421 RepID=A0A6J5T9M1_9CAUD|nr:DNA methylase N-4/N-6 [uncultured Caudovirales phage]
MPNNKPLKPVNLHLDAVTVQDIETHKSISTSDLRRDLLNLKKSDSNSNANNFAGNPFLYHHQFKNLLKCRRQDGKTIYDIAADPTEWNKLIENTRVRNRGGRTAAGNVFECFRINLGSVVMFKATTAKYLYQKYNATKVLDPTAGWGGRMLGAWALGIDYTGIDTNVEMMPAYADMMSFLNAETGSLTALFTDAGSKLDMIWDSCLDVDFSKLDYDFVLTSPPYVNLEIYEHMKEWDNDQAFYTSFFIPLWQRCVDNIKPGGTVCFNISPKMYADALAHGLTPCDEEEDLKQQMGQKSESLKTGKKKQDKIYVWRC